MLAGAKRIIDLFNDNEFEIFIVHGNNGYGKSAYCNRLLAEVYSEDGEHGNWNVSTLKSRIGFHPMRVIDRWAGMRKRDYAFHWDDAGSWLHSLDYQDPFVKTVGKFLQVARTKFGAIMFSCIDKNDIIAKVRNFKSAIIIDITKSGNVRDGKDSKKYRRKATAYSYWVDRLGKTGYQYEWEEIYNCKMPDSFFSWYEPVRNKYADMSIRDMKLKLKEKKDIVDSAKLSDL